MQLKFSSVQIELFAETFGICLEGCSRSEGSDSPKHGRDVGGHNAGVSHYSDYDL